MQPLIKRILRIFLITVITLGLLAVIGGRVATHYIRQTAEKKFAEQNGTFANIDISLFSRSVSIDSLEWLLPANPGEDSTYTLSLQNITVSGIGLWTLWRNKKINVGELKVANGRLIPAAAATHKKDTAANAPPSPYLQNILVKKLAVKDFYAQLIFDSTTRVTTTINMATHNVRLSVPVQPAKLVKHVLDSDDATVTNTTLVNRFYRFTVAQIKLRRDSGSLDIDSLRLLPRHNKHDFSRVAKRQTDRFTLFVPTITVRGLAYATTYDSLLLAKEITIVGPTLHAYRDKRVPFIKNKNTPLPMAMIHDFKSGFAVDSIRVEHGSITYEEFPEEGFHPGRVEFKELNATVAHVANRTYYTGRDHATVKASALLMGQGKLRATFTLPYDEDKMYHAEGNLSALPLAYLNPALENMAFVTIESGQLNAMQFSFDYNDRKSDGTLLLNYKDLRLISLTKESQSSINKFKTWLLNTFLKNDKDKTVSEDRRTGVIAFERDRKRAIFNFWWKSLLSGLRSSVLEATFQKQKKDSKK